MRFLYLEPATDWTDQIVEERLRMCAETLFIHDLINDRTYRQTTTKIRDRADTQRERRVRTAADIPPVARTNAGQ